MASNSTNDFAMNAQDPTSTPAASPVDPTAQTTDPSQPEVIVEEIYEAIIDPFGSSTDAAVSAEAPVEVVEEVVVVEPEAVVAETEVATATPDTGDPTTADPGTSDPDLGRCCRS